MAKPDTERITWFLGLQRILRFPRHSLAPLNLSYFGRKLAVSSPSDMKRVTASFQKGLQASSRLRLVAVGAVSPIAKHLIPTMDGPRQAALFPPIKLIVSKRPSSPLWQLEPPHPPAITKMNQTSQRNKAVKISADQKAWGLRKRYPLLDEASNQPTASNRVLPLAPVRDLSSAQDLLQRDASRFTGTTSADTDELVQGHAVNSGKQLSSLEYSYMHQNFRDAPGNDETSDIDRPQPKRPTVSIIHLDGSVLGRWAIQYLERALGRPATGMTGVDPRATIPRSRVAPF